MRVVGTFSGIGGLELPFHEAGHDTALMCDWWQPSQTVLKHRFPGVDVVGDIAQLADVGLPGGVDVLTAGFPCTDLSQAGRTAGIDGEQSGTVRHVFRLLERHPEVSYLVLENVRNMLYLDKGAAMTFLVERLESLGFRWAYRLVDSRFSGVPQRRHRVLLVASRGDGVDPRSVLFADDAVEPSHEDGSHLRSDAFGFYWTEGQRGLGWAVDSVPPLKGGSTVGIPSPPGIWMPSLPKGERLVTPSVEATEELQGFPRGWTEEADTGAANSPRWKLVGNAVTVGVARWLVGRLESPGDTVVETETEPIEGRWPAAAWGDGQLGRHCVAASAWPTVEPYHHLADVVRAPDRDLLSQRAAAGFLARLRRGSLRRPVEFEADVTTQAGVLPVG